MLHRPIIYTHSPLSTGAAALARALNIKRVRHSSQRPIENRVVINWGSSESNTRIRHCYIMNHFPRVAIASNKRSALIVMQEAGVRVPEFTTNMLTAQDWYDNETIVVCRALLRGSSGRGIYIADPNDPQCRGVTACPLYVKYIKKRYEFRVHIVNEEVIVCQKKMRRRDVAPEDANYRVRSHDNGFIFARENINVPSEVATQAITAMRCLGLDFGAVDVIYNEKAELVYVLEVNTAPGLEGTTIQDYAAAFEKSPMYQQ